VDNPTYEDDFACDHCGKYWPENAEVWLVPDYDEETGCNTIGLCRACYEGYCKGDGEEEAMP
jgi:hypothetical protein